MAASTIPLSYSKVRDCVSTTAERTPSDTGLSNRLRNDANEIPSVTKHEQLYWDFWGQFRGRVADEHAEWTQPRPTSRTAPKSDVGTGTSYTALTSIFGSDGLRVQITFKHKNSEVNTARFDSLCAKKDQFEKVLGGDAVWDDMAGHKSARVYVASPVGSITDVKQWSEMIDWLVNQNERFMRAIHAVGGLETE
jgi:hypothetical protein